MEALCSKVLQRSAAFSTSTTGKLVWCRAVYSCSFEECQPHLHEGKTELEVLLQSRRVTSGPCRLQRVTHLGEGFNGTGKDGLLHVRRDRLQAHDTVQHAENGLVLALCLQKSKSNNSSNNASRNKLKATAEPRTGCNQGLTTSNIKSPTKGSTGIHCWVLV